MATSLNVSAWSTTAASNDGADSTIGTVANTSSPTAVDDWVRGIMAGVKKYVLDIGGGITAGGTANALTITTNRSISSGHQAAGFSVRFKAANTNTGATTVAVDSLSAVSIKRINGDALSAGDIVSGGIYDIAFDGTNYILMGAGTGSGSYGTLSGDNTWTGVNSFNGSTTVGDGSGDTVVIKGTTVNSFVSALFSNSTANSFVHATLGALTGSTTPTSSNNGRWPVDTAGGSGTWRRLTDIAAMQSLMGAMSSLDTISTTVFPNGSRIVGRSPGGTWGYYDISGPP